MSAELRLLGTRAAVNRSPRLGVAALARAAGVLQRNVLVVLVLCAAAGLQTVLSRSAIASDAWYSLLGGRVVSNSGLPHHDFLTVFAQGRAWVDQQWLGHLLLYGLWSAGGWPLTTLVMVAMYAGALALGAGSARLAGASERSTSLIVPVCFLVGLPNTAVRSQVFTYPLFSIVLLLMLADERRPSRRAYAVFPLLVLWANIHGSVVVGALLVSLRGALAFASVIRRRLPASEQLPRAAVLVIAPWACIFASPYAAALPGYYHRTLANPSFSRLVFEWTPSTIRNEPIFFAALLLAAWLGFGRSGSLSPLARLVLPLSAIAGMLAIRNIVWFGLVAVAVLPHALDNVWRPKQTPRHKTLNLTLATVAIVGFSMVAAVSAAKGRSWFEHDYPMRAAGVVAASAASPNSRVFANDRFADWLLFEQPSLQGKVAYDVRFELLSARQLRGIFNFTSQLGPSWRKAAEGYDLLVLDPIQQESVVSFYIRRLHARAIYRDRQVIVLRLSPGGDH